MMNNLCMKSNHVINKKVIADYRNPDQVICNQLLPSSGNSIMTLNSYIIYLDEQREYLNDNKIRL